MIRFKDLEPQLAIPHRAGLNQVYPRHKMRSARSDGASKPCINTDATGALGQTQFRGSGMAFHTLHAADPGGAVRKLV